MATVNNTLMDRSRLLEAASGDLSRTHTLLCSGRRMTDPRPCQTVAAKLLGNIPLPFDMRSA